MARISTKTTLTETSTVLAEAPKPLSNSDKGFPGPDEGWSDGEIAFSRSNLTFPRKTRHWRSSTKNLFQKEKGHSRAGKDLSARPKPFCGADLTSNSAAKVTPEPGKPMTGAVWSTARDPE